MISAPGFAADQLQRAHKYVEDGHAKSCKRCNCQLGHLKEFLSFAAPWRYIRVSASSVGGVGCLSGGQRGRGSPVVQNQDEDNIIHHG